MRQNIIIIFLLFTTLTLSAQKEYNLIPQPRMVREISDNYYRPRTINREIDKTLDIPEEGYRIVIEKRKIQITAKTAQGIVWAERTLEQLKREDGKYPNLQIEDYPEFGIRGFMYDSGRNFVEVADIKHYIDLISMYKLNAFHWHLTDKPAWRIECKVYPQLNDSRYQRIGRDEGRFYTYDEIRDVISYAKERGVMIIPEIDMPGHSDFFNTTFGFSMDSKEGMAVLEKCLEEFFEEIPLVDCPYFHIGSDEVKIDDPKGFMAWAENFVQSRGRKTIAWDPGLPGGKETIYQMWADGRVSAKDLKPDKKFLDNFMGYLNWYDPFVLSNKIFYHTPCVTGVADSTALGGILCLWNDVRVIDNSKILPHNGMLSGLLPFAERFWNGGVIMQEGVDPSRKAAQPINNLTIEVFHRRMAHHRDTFLKNEEFNWAPTQWIDWDITLTGKGGETKTTAKGSTIDLMGICSKLNLPAADTLHCTASAKIWADSDTTINAWIGFDVAARSDRFSDGIPRQGEWGNGGKLYVNGEKIMPPVWEQPGLFRYHYHTWGRPEEEIPYTDEQFYWMRKPSKIQLKKGWNDILINVDRTFQGQRFMFAFVEIQ